MITKPVIALTAALAMAVVTDSSATTVTFEDLNPTPALFDTVPTPYSGFTFSGWFYGPDTVYTPASGTIDLFTDYADPNDPGAFVITNNNAITSATDFFFAGAWFSGYSGVTFELWNDGLLVHTSATLPDAAGPDPYLPTFLASGYMGAIDRVVVSGVQGYYAMDDFTFRLNDVSNVPEPQTLAMVLLALGLGGFVSARKR